MTNKKSGASRRKLLKSIAAGGGAVIAGKSLPDSWSRPVVDAVMLPAHAQTSTTIYSGSNLTRASLDQPSDSMLAGLMDSLIPAAQAGVGSTSTQKGCATIVGTNVDFWIQDVDAGGVLNGEISGVIPLSGITMDVSITTCSGEVSSVASRVAASMAGYIDIEFIGDGSVIFRFPAASACVSKSVCPLV